MTRNRAVRLAMLWTCTAVLAAEDLQAAENTKTQGASMEMVLQKRYLNVPVNNQAPGRSMSLTVDDELLGNFSIPLAEGEPDWWAFYSSENLKDWKFVSRVEQDRSGDELCGCVDFFQLPIGGDANAKKWVMIFIDGSYIVGTFDGHTFYTLSGKPAVTMGRVTSLVIPGNYYATMTWENEPDGRRVQITWMQGGKYPGMPFNQQMTVPVELTLHSTDEGPRMRMNPVKELETLRTKTQEWTDLTLKAGENPLAGVQGDLFDVEVEFEPAANTQTTFDLRAHKVVYDAQAQTLSSGGIQTPLKPDNGVIHLRMLLDRTSIEVFGNHGRVCIPLCIIPKDDNRSLNASCGNGEVKANFLRVHELRSAW